LQVDSLKLTNIKIHESPKVTKLQHKNNIYPRDHFYKQLLFLNGNSSVIDSFGNVLVRLLHNIVPEHLLTKLESTCEKYRQKLRNVTDVRGTHTTVRFGSYIERGGQGRIITVKNISKLENFLEEIDDVGQFINAIFCKVCVEVALNMTAVPEEYKLWSAISLMFWNATNITDSHVDVRDLHWSLVLPFGNFSGGEVDLKYLNTTLTIRRKDMYFINSNSVYHNVLPSFENKKVLVCTNHRSFLARFCKINTTNLYNNLYEQK